MPDSTEQHLSLASQVFITSELGARPAKTKDWSRAKIAVQDLAARIAEDSEQVLPRFVQLAMQMTAGVSSGLSLYEMEPAPGIFRWRHLSGVLARFENTTTPRNDSPCGVTLDQASPVLTRHSERMYQWIADANITLPEVLLVPLFLGGPEPVGTLWIVSDNENHFDSADARLAMELAGLVGIALRMQRNKERLRNALLTDDVLARDSRERPSNSSRSPDRQ